MLDLETLEREAAAGPDGPRALLLPPDVALEGLPAVELDGAESRLFVAGQAIAGHATGPGGLARVYGTPPAFLGVGELCRDGKLTPKRVFRQGEKNL